jgi:hypothetical protein
MVAAQYYWSDLIIIFMMYHSRPYDSLNEATILNMRFWCFRRSLIRRN